MKKVLFISYFWPPSGKASLHWPLDIIRHLPKEEIEPIILTVEDETFTQKDESLLSKVDPGWRVIKSKALEPFDIYRKFIGKNKNEKLIASETISLENKSLAHRISIWIRMNLFVPDARVGWNFTAIKAAKKFLEKEKIDAIISIGPPHSSHLIGLNLSKKFSIPHIPVLIDPWVDIIYYKNFKRNKLTLTLDNHFEKSVLENAKQVIFVTKSAQEDYINKYQFLKDKSSVLYWGYDANSFENITIKKENRNEKLLVHAGNIFAYQNPKKLWDQIKIENQFGNNIKIKFIGTVDNEILNYINQIGLNDFVQVAGFLPFPKMIEEICSADMLLVCSSEPRHVPGKLFEAMRTGNPIIAFGNNNTEVKQILNDVDAGMMFKYDESVAEFFRKNFIKNYDNKNIEKYDREVISREFAALIKSL
ncbi:MAG: glycosyltransferase [Ignavibacteriales bacterium]|nr:glycosyltransferase [Ignavibacteriales bacterium]